MNHFELKKFVSMFALLMFAAGSAGAQVAPVKRWDKTFGVLNANSTLTRVRQASDGNFLVAGYTTGGKGNDKTDTSRGGPDFWILKLDTLGNIIWQRTIGGSSSDEIMDIAETHDHGWLLGGLTDSDSSGDKKSHIFDGSSYWIVRMDSTGAILWDSTYGGGSSPGQHGESNLASVVAVPGGGFLVAGTSYSDTGHSKTSRLIGVSDYWIIRADDDGVEVWQRDFGGTDENGLVSAIHTSDGGFLLAGTSNSDSSITKHQKSYDFNPWLVKTDGDGFQIWEETYDKADPPILTAVAEAKDGGFLLGGYNDSSTAYWILKIDPDGDSVWGHTYRGKPGFFGAGDQLQSIQATADSGFLLAGTSEDDSGADKSENSRGSLDYWVIKINRLGTVEWDKTLGGSQGDLCTSAIETRDGGFVVGGNSSSETSGDKTQDSRTPNNVGVDNPDYWVVALGAEGQASVSTIHPTEDATVFPNPASSVAHVMLEGLTRPAHVTLDDVAGVRMLSFDLQSGNALDLDLRAYPAGIYFLHVRSEGSEYAAKLVKQ